MFQALYCQKTYKQKESNFNSEASTCLGNELIDIIINSGKEKFNITTSKQEKFLSVASSVCEIAGWNMSNTRFLLNGDRLQNDKTFLENDVDNLALIDVMFEQVGGKGPSHEEEEEKIRKMLEANDSETDDEETDNSCGTKDETTNESNDSGNNNRLYESLQNMLRNGTLELDRMKPQDQKLLFLLETEHLQPYELLRLRNVYSFWEQTKDWKGSSENNHDKMKPTKQKIKTCTKVSKQVVERPRRTIADISNDETDYNDETTPRKRRRLLECFGLNTPSPLKKYSNIDKT